MVCRRLELVFESMKAGRLQVGLPLLVLDICERRFPFLPNLVLALAFFFRLPIIMGGMLILMQAGSRSLYQVTRTEDGLIAWEKRSTLTYRYLLGAVFRVLGLVIGSRESHRYFIASQNIQGYLILCLETPVLLLLFGGTGDLISRIVGQKMSAK